MTRIVEERTFPEDTQNGESTTPRIYPAPDYPFRGWQPPHPEGYRDSAATPGDSAIVLDNGKSYV
jgi:actin-related protein 5